MNTYLISKLSYDSHKKTILSAHVYLHDSKTYNMSSEGSKDRNWLVQKVNLGDKLYFADKLDSGLWSFGNEVTYSNGSFTWNGNLPKDITKRKTFLCYHHKNDSARKNIFLNRFGDLIVNKSVAEGDIDSENSDQYIKQLIQKGYLEDTTVMIVLLGSETQNRMHIDWEISGALNVKVGDGYAGLLGILLPTHPDYGKGKIVSENLPKRFAENFKTGYAIIREWTDDRATMQEYIEMAYNNRKTQTASIVNKAIPQMTQNK